MQSAVRPFISFLTDFGPDAAAAICRGVMIGIAPDVQIVDVAHSIDELESGNPFRRASS